MVVYYHFTMRETKSMREVGAVAADEIAAVRLTSMKKYRRQHLSHYCGFFRRGRSGQPRFGLPHGSSRRDDGFVGG